MDPPLHTSPTSYIIHIACLEHFSCLIVLRHRIAMRTPDLCICSTIFGAEPCLPSWHRRVLTFTPIAGSNKPPAGKATEVAYAAAEPRLRRSLWRARTDQVYRQDLLQCCARTHPVSPRGASNDTKTEAPSAPCLPIMCHLCHSQEPHALVFNCSETVRPVSPRRYLTTRPPRLRMHDPLSMFRPSDLCPCS